MKAAAEPALLFLIPSSDLSGGSERRWTTRRALDAAGFHMHAGMLRRFVVGSGHTVDAQNHSLDEVHLQVDDSYDGLASKVLHGLRYLVREEIEPWDYVLKMDTDTWACPVQLQRALRNASRTGVYYGLNVKRRVLSGRADPHFESFFHNERYGPYAPGGAYLLSRDVAAHAVTRSEQLGMFNTTTMPRIEDGLMGSLVQDAYQLRRFPSGLGVATSFKWSAATGSKACKEQLANDLLTTS